MCKEKKNKRLKKMLQKSRKNTCTDEHEKERERESESEKGNKAINRRDSESSLQSSS